MPQSAAAKDYNYLDQFGLANAEDTAGLLGSSAKLDDFGRGRHIDSWRAIAVTNNPIHFSLIMSRSFT